MSVRAIWNNLNLSVWVMVTHIWLKKKPLIHVSVSSAWTSHMSSPWELSREGVTPLDHLATIHCSARLALKVVWGRGERRKSGRRAHPFLGPSVGSESPDGHC